MAPFYPTGCCICPSLSLPGVSCVTQRHILSPGIVVHAKVLSALCSAWTPCAAPTLKCGSGCVHVPQAQPWSGRSHCNVRMLHLWRVCTSLHVLCVHNLWDFQGGRTSTFPRYENGGPHHPPDTPCITSFSPSRVCSFGHQMTLHVICLLSSSLLFTKF